MTEDELEKLKRELCDIQCGCNGKAGRCIIEDTICAALDELNSRGLIVGDVCAELENAKEIMKGAFIPNYDENGIDNQPLWMTVIEELGVYPVSVTQGGVETKRTEKQDGWNEAVIKATSMMCELLRQKTAAQKEGNDE